MRPARFDLDRVSVDSFNRRAVKKGDLTGADPVDRGKRGSKLHLAGERGGLPPSVVLSVANTADSAMFEAVLGRHPGDPDAHRPPAAPANAYDHRRCRAYLRRRGIRPRIARRMIEPSERLGRHRWIREWGGAMNELIELAEGYSAHNYHPLPGRVREAEGAWVTDVEGKHYLDMLSAYSALNFGHRHPRARRRPPATSSTGSR